jgi:Transcription factor WhiB
MAIIRAVRLLEAPCSVEPAPGDTNTASKLTPMERADRTHGAVPGTVQIRGHSLRRLDDHETRHHKRQLPETTMDTISQLPEFDDEIHPAVIRTVGPRCADGNGTLTPLFFSDDLVDIGRAKAICARCMLRANCLADAIDRKEPSGVWGGEMLLNGRIVTFKRASGRPPKRPRPPMIIDEMGIVPVQSVA